MVSGFSSNALSHKVYVMKRDATGHPIVLVKGRKEKPLKHIVRYSPSGLEWGYGGSGPADLALSILSDAVGRDLADCYHQDFKWFFISRIPWDGGEITESQIAAWLWERVCQEA